MFEGHLIHLIHLSSPANASNAIRIRGDKIKTITSLQSSSIIINHHQTAFTYRYLLANKGFNISSASTSTSTPTLTSIFKPSLIITRPTYLGTQYVHRRLSISNSIPNSIFIFISYLRINTTDTKQTRKRIPRNKQREEKRRAPPPGDLTLFHISTFGARLESKRR